MKTPAKRAGTQTGTRAEERKFDASSSVWGGSGGGTAEVVALTAAGVVNEAPHWGQRTFLFSGSGREDRRPE
jgi:hypothetical protein